MKLFPNPASSRINLVNPLADGQHSLTIIDLSGRVVMKKTVSSSQHELISLDISGLEGGMYLIHLENPESIFQGKIIIVR